MTHRERPASRTRGARHAALAASLAAVLAGCVAATPDNTALLGQPVPRGQSRLVLTRTDDLLYLAAPASVALDGKPVADIPRGGRFALDVDPGRHRLDVTAWSAPGSFAVTFTAGQGRSYAFEISPRGENYVIGAAFGLAGSIVDAAVNENTGPFKIVPR